MSSQCSTLFYPITSEGRRGTRDKFATIPFRLFLFSATLVELAILFLLILFSHLFFCLPLFLFPFSMPHRIVSANPEDLETWPNDLSFRFLIKIKSSSNSPMAVWVFLIDVLHHGIFRAAFSLTESFPLQAVYDDHSRNPRLVYGSLWSRIHGR